MLTLNKEIIVKTLSRLANIDDQRRVWLNIDNDQASQSYDMSSLEEDMARIYIDSGLHHYLDANLPAFSSIIDHQIIGLLRLAASDALYQKVNTELDLLKPEMIQLRRIAKDILAAIECLPHT